MAGVFRNNELAMTYSHMGNPTLPSARRGFTSEFGKGSGGSLLLLSPAQLLWCFFGLNWMPIFHQILNRLGCIESYFKVFILALVLTKSSIDDESSLIQQLFGCCIVKPHDQLVLVSFTYHYASTSNLSTS